MLIQRIRYWIRQSKIPQDHEPGLLNTNTIV